MSMNIIMNMKLIRMKDSLKETGSIWERMSTSITTITIITENMMLMKSLIPSESKPSIITLKKKSALRSAS